MKTIEQKAKAYNKALERAKEKYTTCYSPALLEYIFPELNESNDKEIREDIINNLKRYINCIKDGYDAPSAKDFVVKEIEKQIAWLEKQDNKSVNIDIESMVSSYKQRLKSQTGIRAENNPLVNMSLIAFRHGVENTLEELNLKKLEKQGDKDSQIKLPTFTFDDILALQCCMETVKKVQNDKDLYEKLNDLHGRMYDAYHLEKQGEQKPKFKVGDWICNDACDVHIASIEDGMYYFDEGDGLSIAFVDERYHLWAIEDAIDGDVLVDVYGNIGIFEKRYGINWHTYCYLENEGRFISEGGSHGSICYPATKSQRGALMKAMTDAEYSFDFEKKELKKLGQSEVTKTSDQEIGIAEIPFGAKDSELQEATYYIPKGFHAEIDDDKVVIKKGEKHTAWSEDDERIKKRLINLVNELYNNINYITFLEHKELLAWLEKLDDNIEL